MLADRRDLDLLIIPEADRKSAEVRQQFLRRADVAILCLPDRAATEALELIGDADTRVIDSSSARRVDPEWVYGLPEMTPEQRGAIANGRRVANPGCYPQSFILGVRPLIEAGRLDPQTPFTVNAVSGYSGGGRAMVERYRSLPVTDADAGEAASSLCLYGLGGRHKHLPEMHRFSGAANAPLFVPSVDHTFCGMLVSIPLPAPYLSGLTREEIHRVWSERYAGEPFVQVLSPTECDSLLRDGQYLELGDREMGNRLELLVYGDEHIGLVLVGRLDNLGKGASGSAVQCLNLMLGLDERLGLSPDLSVAA